MMIAKIYDTQGVKIIHDVESVEVHTNMCYIKEFDKEVHDVYKQIHAVKIEQEQDTDIVQ